MLQSVASRAGRSQRAAERHGGGSSSGGDTLLLALALSDATNAYVSTGTGFADHFDSTSMVDVAGATNLVTSEAGYLKPSTSIGSHQVPTMSSGTTSGVTVSGSLENTPAWKAFDGLSTTGDEWRCYPRTSSEWLKVDFGPGNAKRIGRYRFKPRPSDGTTFCPTAWTFQGSNNNSAWTTLDSRTGLSSGWTNSTFRDFDCASIGVFRYYQWVFTGFVDASFLILSEVEMLAGTVNDLTVASQNLPASVVPSTIRAALRVLPTDALTLNTDLMVDVTRNGGANWATANLSLSYTDGGISLLEAEIDVSAQAAPSSPRWRIRGDNDKSFKVDGISLYFI